MKLAILKETADAERRVAATPETVKKFIALGAEVAVEAGAGLTASIADSDYEAAGASVGPRGSALAGADAILGVQGPDAATLQGARPGALVVAMLDPFRQRERIDAYAAAGLEALAMELMPRITRAQSMDVLSSQANLAGYKAVLDAAARIWPRLPDDDDRGGHDPGREGVRDGRRGRRAPGDRHRPPARGDRLGDRRPRRDPRADREPRRQGGLRRDRRRDRGRGRRRLRDRDVGRV